MQPLRSLVVLAGLMAMGTCFAQDALVSLSKPAATVENVIAELAKASGESIAASGTIKGEIVFLSVKDQPISVVKAQLARVVDAEWRQEGETSYLTRTPGIIAKQIQNETAARARLLQAEIKKMVEQNKALAEFDVNEAQRITGQFQTAAQNMMGGGGGNQGWRRFVELNNQLPTGRAMVDLLAQMNVNDLASMSAGSRRVFALRPTRMQVALPSGAINVVRKMVADQRMFEKIATEQFGETAQFFLNGGRTGTIPGGDVTNVMIIATRFGAGNTINLSLHAINAANESLVSGNVALGIPPDTTSSATPSPLGEGKPIQLSEDSKVLLQAMRRGGRGGTFITGGGGGATMTVMAVGAPGAPAGNASDDGKDAPVSLTQKLMRPDLIDPHAFFVSDALLSISRAHDRNVVALLPDNAFSALSGPLGGADPKTDAVLNALKNGDMDVQVENGWVRIAPLAPVTAREKVDRAALARLLAIMSKTPAPGLDDVANYFSTAPSASGMPFGSIDTTYASALNASASFQQLMQTFGRDREALKFYGRLSMTQRTSLKTGAPMQIGTLSPNQKEALDRLVFWSPDGPQLSRPQEQEQGRGRVEAQVVQRAQMRIGGAMFGFGFDPSSERTTLLTTGLPSFGTVQMKGELEPMVLARTKGSSPTLLSVFALAANQAALNGSLNAMANGVRMAGIEYDSFALAGQMNYTLTLNLAPNYSMSRTLEDSRIDANVRYVPYNELPVPFRNQVDQAIRQMQRGGPGGGGGFMGMPGGGGGGQRGAGNRAP